METVLQVAELGFKIIPVQQRNKIPLVKNWPKAATNDPATIKQWASSYPNCNWGIATGKRSGIFVVDIDPKNGGDKTWRNLVKQHGEPLTVTVLTGSKGLHFYFKLPQDFDVGSTAGALGQGIDTRGEGGQVIIPPSIHANGNQYQWVEGRSPMDVKVATAPDWILTALREYAASGLTALGGVIPEGTKNNNVYHHSLLLARQGATQEFVLNIMKEWCKENRVEGIDDAELEATVVSAFKKAEADKKISVSSTFERTDDDNAKRFLADHGDKVLYVPGMGWHVWSGKHWEYDADNAHVTNFAIETMRALREEALEDMRNPVKFKEAMAKASWANQSLNVGRLSAMIELASKSLNNRMMAEEMDGAHTTFLFNCGNGTLDLRTGELREARKSDYITKLCAIDYNPVAKCPTWLDTMDLAFEGNTNLISFMQRALGYTLTGSVSEQCLFIAWGESGNNGKSTILEAVQRILGTGYAQMSDMKVVTSLEMDNRVASSMAKLQGARMVSMNEAEEHQKMSESIVKQLTGGDTVEACKKYHEPFNYIPTFKLWVRTNDKPTIRGVNDAIWRRIKLIPFVHPIPSEKRKRRDVIDAALAAEAEGILAWCVAGAKMWFESGLQAPEVVNEAVNAYRSEMDIVQQFFDECIIESDDPTIYCNRSDMYQAFIGWCKENGYKFFMSADSFGRRFSKKLQLPQSREKRKGTYIWTGVRLTETAAMYTI